MPSPPAVAPGSKALQLGLHIHGATPDMVMHVKDVVQTNVGGMPEIDVTRDLDQAAREASGQPLAELKIRLGTRVDRQKGSTRIDCQMAHMIYRVQSRPEGLKRVLRASNRYRAQVDLGAEADAMTAEAEQRACFETLAPLIVSDLRTWMSRDK